MAGAYFRGFRPGQSRPTSRERRCGLDAADCAGVGFGAIRAGGFLPVEAGGCKTVASAYFGGRRACTQYDPRVILGAKASDLEGDAYCGSQES